MRKDSITKLLVGLLIRGALCLTGALWAQDTPVYFAPDPGPAKTEISSHDFALWNKVLSFGVSVSDGRIDAAQFQNFIPNGTKQERVQSFSLLLTDGTVLPASALTIITPPRLIELTPSPQASRLSDRIAGVAIVTELDDSSKRLHINWRLILHDGSNYLREEIAISANGSDLPIREVRLLDWLSANTRISGTVKGSPILGDEFFAGFEDPLSTCAVANQRARCWVERELPLKAGQSVTYSSVIGVAPSGQMRRAFLHYLERERAHPYRTFLHYNSWYDLGYFSKYDEAGALNVINTFGTELTRKRGVPIASFLFDDGWDDPTTLWQFNSGFPDGFTKLRTAAASYGTAPGVWMSPWGGYGKPKQQRVANGRAAGYEIVENGFALSGPKYYSAFRDTCFKFVRDYGVNQFKFDGTGNADRVVPGSSFDSDFSAAIHLIGELRAFKPDLYINLTTGTYPSPFWLRYADSIWRGGEDHEFLGVGPKREQWITYRDADTYEHVVLSGPLFPLNSLMLHGLIYAKYAKNLDTDPQSDFTNEVRDYFGNGTQLQEMYITPSLLSTSDWNNLAEAAAWSQRNADVLVDTHWIGGDPAMLEVYGWSSWSPKKAILVLRNPADKPQEIMLDVARAFELPAGYLSAYSLRSPWKEDQRQPSLIVRPGQPQSFALKPFQVLVLEGTPAQ